MKYKYLVQRSLLFTVPLVTVSTVTSTVTIQAAQAATFASSSATTTLSDFRPLAIEPATEAGINTQSIATDLGSVTAHAEALAFLSSSEGNNFSISQAEGKGLNYSGVANSFATVIGWFQVAANQSFSFNFFSRLNLLAVVENSRVETASAFGAIRYGLFNDTTDQLLDSFTLFGQVSSSSGFNTLGLVPSEHVSLSQFSGQLRFSENQAIALAEIGGVYSRTFASATDLRLEEIKINQARVQTVPTPAVLPGIFTFLILSLKRWCTKNHNDAKQFSS